MGQFKLGDDAALQVKWEFLQRIREREIDQPDAPAMYREFVAYLDKSPRKPAHYVRYCQTFLSLIPYLQILPGRTVLETGGFCEISLFLKNQGFDCRKTSSDLRYEIDAESNSVDLVLSLEVIEHIKDQTETALDAIVQFGGTGVRKYVSEMQRVLKPGGILVLTTPNPCSFRAMELLLAQKPPMLFRPHVREYSRQELLEFFVQMELLEAETRFAFFHLALQLQNQWDEVFERNGWDKSNRGDDHFLVFRRPRGSL